MVYLKQTLTITSFLLLSIVSPGYSYPNGEGISSSCTSLVPGHGSPVQTSRSPYRISFSQRTYTSGSPISVTLDTCSGAGFKGFLIQARRADKNHNQNEALGNFSIVTNTRQTCPGSTALAHVESSSKNLLSFNWYPPSAPQGHIVFRGTFVREYQIYWADVISEILTDASINTAFTASDFLAATPLDISCVRSTSSDTTNSNLGVKWAITPSEASRAEIGNQTAQYRGAIKDTACGVTKGCFSNCKDSVCSFVISWNEDGDYGVFTLTANVASSNGAYMALGFSSDDQMGDDSVTGCASTQDGSVVLFNGQNTGEVPPTLFTDNNVSLVNHTILDGVFTCTFRRLTAASVDGKRFDISKPWILLFATGSASASTNNVRVQYHGTANRFASSAPYKISDTTDSVAKTIKFPLVKAHGSLMAGAWIFLASVGIVVARYYKQVWNNLVISQKIWFQLHRTCMVLVFSATVAGFIIIFVEVQGWSELSEAEGYQRAHPIMGVIVTVLTVLNPIMALFRPHPETPRRPIFNWAHWFVGMAAHILAVITIFFGVRLDKAGVPDYLIYILAAYVAWQVFVMLLLELTTYYGQKRDRKDMYELRTSDGETSESNFPVMEGSWSKQVKRNLFVIHTIIVGALAVAVIVIISMD